MIWILPHAVFISGPRRQGYAGVRIATVGLGLGRRVYLEKPRAPGAVLVRGQTRGHVAAVSVFGI